MVTKQVQGADGQLSSFTITTSTVAADTILTEGAYYLCSAVGSGSKLPSGLEPGYTFYAGAAMTTVTGDQVKLITESIQCVQNITFSSSKEFLDNTTLCSNTKGNLPSNLSDYSGSLEGIVTIGSAFHEMLISKQHAVAKQNADRSTYTITAQNDDILYLKYALNKTSTKGEDTHFRIIPVYIGNYSPAAIQNGTLQTFSVDFASAIDEKNGIVVHDLIVAPTV